MNSPIFEKETSGGHTSEMVEENIRSPLKRCSEIHSPRFCDNRYTIGVRQIKKGYSLSFLTKGYLQRKYYVLSHLSEGFVLVYEASTFTSSFPFEHDTGPERRTTTDLRFGCVRGSLRGIL